MGKSTWGCHGCHKRSHGDEIQGCTCAASSTGEVQLGCHDCTTATRATGSLAGRLLLAVPQRSAKLRHVSLARSDLNRRPGLPMPELKVGLHRAAAGSIALGWLCGP